MAGRLSLACAAVLAAVISWAGTAPAAELEIPRRSPKARVSQRVGPAEMTVDYNSPAVRGRAIWGAVVPFGEVWRTGANAATTLKTSSNLQIGTLAVPAGTYTLYSLPTADGWTLIVNKQTGRWGTKYDKAQDLGRVPMSAGSNSSPSPV